MVDLHRQYLGIRDEVDRAIGDVIAETAFIKGPAVGLFEEELARRLEVRHCIACGNGTDALLLSLLAVGLQRGDEVIVPAFAFAAVAETVLLLGGGGFAFMQYQKKQREVAMKAAQRRAQAARNADRPVARQAGQPQQMRTGAYTTPQQRPQTSNGVSPVQVRPATPVPQTQDMQNRPQVGYRTPIQPLTKPQETPSTAAPKSTTTMENPYARPVAKSAEEAPRHRRRTDQYRQDDDSANPNG